MLTHDAPTLGQAQAAYHAPVYLLAIVGWGGGTVRYCSSGADVTWDGSLWDGRRFAPGGLELSGDGVAAAARVTIDDADLAVSIAVWASSPQGLPASLWRLYLDPASWAPVGAHALTTGLSVGALTYARASLAFDLTSARRRRQAPGLPYQRACSRTYADPDTGFNQCQYAEVCGHTWEDCESYAYQANYGGVPALARRRW